MSEGMIEYKGYTGSIRVDTEEGILHGRIEFINDLVTFEAETVPKLKVAFRKVVDEYVKTCATIGKAPEKPFSGSFNVRIGPELHRQAALAAKRSEIALNEFVRKAVEGQLKRGDAPVVLHKHDHTVHHVVEPAKSFVVGEQSAAGGPKWQPMLFVNTLAWET